jgi:CheY-like chemotaxis protein
MPLAVLLIDDNTGDLRLTREAFLRVNPNVNFHVAYDGVAAMAFLKREGVHVNAPRPNLIVLDLNLPKMDGRDVLSRIKDDMELKSIPTVVLTSSEAEAYVENSYLFQANCYLTKPTKLNDLEELLRSIGTFWLKTAKLPRKLQPYE